MATVNESVFSNLAPGEHYIGNKNQFLVSDEGVASTFLRLQGNDNVLYGNNCRVEGDRNTIHGNDNLVKGVGNKLVGNGNQVFGDDNHCLGDHNTIRGKQGGGLGSHNRFQGDEISFTNAGVVSKSDSEFASATAHWNRKKQVARRMANDPFASFQ